MNLAALINDEVALTPEELKAEAPPAPKMAEVIEIAPAPTAAKSAARESLRGRAVKAAPVEPVGEGNIKQRAHQLTLYLEQPVFEQLRELAFHEKAKMHPLILEAIDMLFRKKNLPSMAQLTKAAKS